MATDQDLYEGDDWDDWDYWDEGNSDESDDADPWLCMCGHYEESGLHCSECGNEPPWGCDCSSCGDVRDGDDDDYFDDYEY